MSKEKTSLELVVEQGDIIYVECPVKYTDELYETLDHAMKRKDWWTPAQFDGCTAMFNGLSLSRIAMSRVVGIL